MIHADFPPHVRIGGQSKLALTDALREHSVRLNHAADACLGDDRFTTLEDGTTIKIECLSVAEMGFTNGATYDQSWSREGAIGVSSNAPWSLDRICAYSF